MPGNHRVVDWSPDGTWFLTLRENQPWALSGLYARVQVLYKVSADGKTIEPLTPTGGDGPDQSMVVENAALSPDGTRVAYQQRTMTAVQGGKQAVHYPGFKVVVLDLARNARTVVASEPGGKVTDEKYQMNTSFGVRWSPDGSRIGFLYEHRELGTPFVVGWRVGVVGADGHGAKTVFDSARTDPKAPPPALTLFDWR